MMKSAPALTAIFFTLLLQGCNKHYDNFLLNKNKKKSIALQPLGQYNTGQLNFISREISNFYNRKVIILKPMDIPVSFRLGNNEELYSADSILQLLTANLTNDVIEVIGLTHKDIYTLKKEKYDPINNPHPGYSVHTIFGYGYLQGDCCVISDHRFHSPETLVSQHRLRTVTLHETGHNLGLQHCSTAFCIMSDQNGTIPVLDKSEKDYFKKCKDKL